jgi:hypothetical protein
MVGEGGREERGVNGEGGGDGVEEGITMGVVGIGEG